MIKINLLPSEYQRKAAEIINVWWFSIIPVLVIVFLVPVYVSKLNQINKTKTELEDVKRKIDKYKNVKDELEKINEEIKQVEAQISFITDKKEKQKFWSKVLERLEGIMPVDVELESLNVDEEGRVTAVGKTFSYRSAANFIRTLNKSKYFEGAKGTFTKSYGTAEGGDIVDFSMNFTFKNIIEEEKKK